jgi:hypothetical protein
LVFYFLRGFIQVSSRGVWAVAGWEAEREAVASVAWEDVQVRVKDFLAGGLPVREKEVDAFTFQSTGAHCHGETLSDPKHLRALFFIQIFQIRGMPVRDDKHVAGVNRVQVHKR